MMRPLPALSLASFAWLLLIGSPASADPSPPPGVPSAAASPSKKVPEKPRADSAAPPTTERVAPADSIGDGSKTREPKKEPKPKSDGSSTRTESTRETELDADSTPASPKPAGPGAGTGERKIRPAELSEAPAVTPKRAEPAAAKGHRPGKPPKVPSATLPEGATPAVADDDARRQIAGGPTVDDLAAPKSDPELEKLREAERVLFPRPLRGVHAGFSFDFPVADDAVPSVEASGLPPAFSSQGRAHESNAVKATEWLRGLAMPDLPTRLEARVVKYLEFYRDDARGKSIAQNWAKKASRLAPAIQAELAKAGLPTDLVWLSLIESGHNPLIVSSAGAAGLWQFIPESARMYGLTVDRWVDERLDPVRSTEAAVRYLNDLRSRFGSWELAMAAYNMGHGSLLRAVRKYNTNDYWTLSRYEAGLPWETTLYVPKILATAIVMDNRKAFGLDGIEPDPPLTFDTLMVRPNTELADVARAAGVPLEDIRALNAEYLSLRTPPVESGPDKRWPVRVPSGSGVVTAQRLASTPLAQKPKLDPYVVRFGDTLDTIALDTGAAPRDIAVTNHVTADERLKAGAVLLVSRAPGDADSRPPADEEAVVVPARAAAAPERARVFYRVVPGDTLSDVARAFDVTPSELSAWNTLDPRATLQSAMTIQVYVKPSLDLSGIRCLAEHEVRVLVAGSEEFYAYFEAQNGRKRITVTAKKGDTLATIGRRHGMTNGMMERINHAAARAALREGDKVVVYAKGVADSLAPADLASALAEPSPPKPDLLPPLSQLNAPSANGTRAVSR